MANVPEKLTFCLTNQRRGRGVRTTCHRRFHQCRRCSNWCCGVDDHRDRRVFLLFNERGETIKFHRVIERVKRGEGGGGGESGIKTEKGQKSMPISATKRRDVGRSRTKNNYRMLLRRLVQFHQPPTDWPNCDGVSNGRSYPFSDCHLLWGHRD